MFIAEAVAARVDAPKMLEPVASTGLSAITSWVPMEGPPIILLSYDDSPSA